MRRAARISEAMQDVALEMIEPGLPKNKLSAELFSTAIRGLKDENGDEYWYNSITKETSWEDWSTAATKIGDDAASAWTNVKDENGYDYWHNPTTNETS